MYICIRFDTVMTYIRTLDYKISYLHVEVCQSSKML